MLTSNAQSSGLRTCDLQKKKEEPLNSYNILYVLALLRLCFSSKNINKDNRYENNRGKGYLGICVFSVQFNEILDSPYGNRDRLH